MALKNKFASGIFYTALAKYSNVFFSIFIGAILARLLSPKEFGIVAIVTIFTTFFNLLCDFGIGPAVVQNQDLDEKDTQSIFSFSILFGILLAGLFFMSAHTISNFYNDPALINIVKFLSISILFYSIQVVPNAITQKKLKFKQIGYLTVFVQLTTGILAVILAYNGFSYYALIIKSIIDSLLTFVGYYWLAPIRIRINIKKSSIQKIIKFSLFQFMFNFINYFSRNADNLLIGKYFNTSSLAFYDKSYRLMLLPVYNLTHVITPVLMPILSKYQDDKLAVYTSYLKVVRILATIGFPLSVFLFFSANELITIVYGNQWLQSIPVFKLLALTVGIQMVLSSSGSIFQVVNRTDLLFYSGLISSISMVFAIVYGIFVEKNLEAICYGLIIAFSFNFIQGFYMLINMAMKFSFLNFLKIFISPITISIGIATILWSTSNIHIINPFYSLIIKSSLTIIVFFLLFIISIDNRKWVLQNWNALRSK